MRKIFFIIVGILMQFTLTAHDENFKPLLDSAFKAYSASNFQKCIDYYHQIEQKGYSSAYMYYNMGNAYFRQKEIAEAILYYERAHLLNPSDIDITHNLQFANTFVSDKINELPDPFYTILFKDISNWFSANTWAWLAILSFIISLILVYFNFLTSSLILSRLYKGIATSLFVLFLITGTFAYYSHKTVSSHKEAILMSDSVEVKSSPDDSGTMLFVLHEGTKVTIREEFEEWAEIKIADGNTGWIKLKDVERI
jgi:tetratricopeptide (TPR) repeat protein